MPNFTTFEIDTVSPVNVNYDLWGRIVSVNYYTPDNELLKQVFYSGEDISHVNYYRSEKLYKTEEFAAGNMTFVSVYKKDGKRAYNANYEYDKLGRVCAINKTTDKDVRVEYIYDQLDRITERKIYIDKKLVKSQEYAYDVLNRVIGYKDENQKIYVSNISKKNELLSYTITDRMGNKTFVDNKFSETGYMHTEITSGTERSVIKDKSYVDNIMLKKPYTTEDDLDLIISNLFNTSAAAVSRTDYNEAASRSTQGFINDSLKLQTLPISIRKRVLYNIAAKSFTNQD